MRLSSRQSHSGQVSLSVLPAAASLMVRSAAVSTPSLHTKEPVTEWHPQEFQEFVPQAFDGQMVCIGLVFFSPI